MRLVYLSLTGQTRKFINKLGNDSYIDLAELTTFEAKEPWLLFVPTYPMALLSLVDDFLLEEEYLATCCGIVGSGNRNFAQDFCFSAYQLAEEYGLAVLYCYEFQGDDQDVLAVKEIIEKYEKS